MITIDAPLYPLLLIEKSSESPELSKDSGEYSRHDKPDGASKSDESFESKAKTVDPKSEEIYSWSSFVRNNFVVDNKAKKKGDLWKKLEQYRKV